MGEVAPVSDLPSALLPTVLKRVRWAVPLNEARALLPELFAVGGLRDEALHSSLWPVISEAGLLRAIQIEFDSVEHRDRILATWGDRLRGVQAGQAVEVVMRERDGLRAVALDLARDPRMDCAHVAPAGLLSGCSVRVEEYWGLDAQLDLLGFGEGGTLLHATVQELRARFGHRFRQRRRSPVEKPTFYLAVPALGAASDEAVFSLTFHGDRAGIIGLSVSGAGPGVDHARIMDRARNRLGVPREHEGALYYGVNPQLTMYLSGPSVSYLSLRDTELCPSDDERFATWLAARRTALGASTELLSLSAPPYALIRQVERLDQGCRTDFYKVHVDGELCSPRKINAELLATDCCDQQCAPRGPLQAMLRLRTAVKTRDMPGLRAFLPPGRAVTLSESRLDDGETGASTPPLQLSRDGISESALRALRGFLGESWPQCPPDYELDNDSSTATSDPTDIRCFVGATAGCGTLFHWKSTPEGLFLDDVAFHCC